MFIKRLLISLGTLGIASGAGLGIYYSLKENDNEIQILPLTNIDNDSDDNIHSLVSVIKGSVSDKSSPSDIKSSSQASDPLTVERSPASGVVKTTTAAAVEPEQKGASGVISELPIIKVLVQENSDLEEQNLGTKEEEEAVETEIE